MANLYIIFPIKLTMIINKNFMKLLSQNVRIKSNILWPKMSLHVNKGVLTLLKECYNKAFESKEQRKSNKRTKKYIFGNLRST